VPRPGKDQTESGVLVYPRMPMPKPQGGPERESKPPKPKERPLNKLLLVILGGALLGGLVVGAVLRPLLLPDSRIAAAEQRADEAGSAAAAAKTRADGLEKDLDALGTKKREVEKRLEVASKAEVKLADTAAESEKRTKELEATQKKLAAGLRGLAMVAVDGEDLRITINTGVLFVKDDVLSDRGKQVIDKVGVSLKEMLDKQAAVYGHTDDTAPPLPKPAPAPAPAPPKKGMRPAPAAPAPAAPPPRFPTNWELSAGRAVAVVRHLQEASKIDPARLSAAGFAQYRPISRRDRNANRRIEIVLSPRPKK
jgi:chemotaxis protein MotB